MLFSHGPSLVLEVIGPTSDLANNKTNQFDMQKLVLFLLLLDVSLGAPRERPSHVKHIDNPDYDQKELNNREEARKKIHDELFNSQDFGLEEIRLKILHPSRSEKLVTLKKDNEYDDRGEESLEEEPMIRFEPIKAKGIPAAKVRPSKIAAPRVLEEMIHAGSTVNAQRRPSLRVPHQNALKLEDVISKETSTPFSIPMSIVKVNEPNMSKVNDSDPTSTTHAPQFEAFYPREAYGIPNSAVRAPHGHGSFYKYRNPALVDTKNAAAYGFRFDGKRRFNFDAEGSIEIDFDSEAPAGAAEDLKGLFDSET